MNVSGYKSFGSFFSENVEELVRNKEFVENQLEKPFTETSNLENEDELFSGGKNSIKLFLLGNKYTFLNHGAFGAPLSIGFEVAQEWRRYVETQPVKYIDRELLPFTVKVIGKLSRFLSCDAPQLVFVPNASFGLNAIIGKYRNKKVFLLDICYGSVKKMVEAYQCKFSIVPVTFPTNKELLLQLVEDNLTSDFDLAVFDHITSNTALCLPIKELTEICHRKGVKVFIDGAHSLGHVPVNLREIKADYFVGNCHKWFGAPRGCAFLYSHEGGISSPIVTQAYASGFTSEFAWFGNADYSPYMALDTIIDFWTVKRRFMAHKYCHNLLQKAKDLLLKDWNVDDWVPQDLHAPFMTLIPLPTNNQDVTSSHAKTIQDTLFSEYLIEVPIKHVCDKLFVRIACFLYNELNDYKKLSDAILSIKTKYPHLLPQ